jgi:hypothetical protein
LFGVKDNLEVVEHLPDEVKLAVHNVADQNDDWLHDELNEAAGKLATCTIFRVSGELLGLGVVVVVTPELLHELEKIDLELVSIDTSEAGQGESPTEKSGTESDSTVGRIDLLRLAHIIALVGGDDDVGVLNDTLEVLIHGLTIDLEFKDTTIDLVDEEDWLDLFTEGLTEHSFSLHANTFDVIDDDKSTISDTEGSSDF